MAAGKRYATGCWARWWTLAILRTSGGVYSKRSAGPEASCPTGWTTSHISGSRNACIDGWMGSKAGATAARRNERRRADTVLRCGLRTIQQFPPLVFKMDYATLTGD